MPLLHPGDAFPELSLTVPGGETAQVPEAFAGQFGVMLFNRGSWCPYCNAQLRAFQRASATLADAGGRVAGYLPVHGRQVTAREPSHRAAGRASTAISAVTKEVNGTGQALHTADIPRRLQPQGPLPRCAQCPARQGISWQCKIPTKSPQLTGPTSHTRAADFCAFPLIRSQIRMLPR